MSASFTLTIESFAYPFFLSVEPSTIKYIIIIHFPDGSLQRFQNDALLVADTHLCIDRIISFKSDSMYKANILTSKSQTGIDARGSHFNKK